MSTYCVLEQLPTELIHLLFSYFSAPELFLTFFNINDYVNATLESYSSYQLDLRCISKSDFRRICRHVHPEQVISLTLSDGNDTPGQSELFFSRFRIEQFIRLRSLTLIGIEYNSLESIFSNLPQLQQLRSFSFDAYTIRHTYGSMDLNSQNKLQHMNDMLRNTYAQIFPRLNFLYLNGGWVLDSIPLPNLVYLKLKHCSTDKINRIAELVPALRSLDICLNIARINFESMPLPSQLTRLNLKIQSFSVTMTFMEMVLSDRFSLKHLELQAIGFADLANGYRWQRSTNSLITFNFKFHIVLHINELSLSSFRTSYWLEQKQWFVAYQDKCLFSVPHFSPQQLSSSYQLPLQSTAPNNLDFYKNVTKLVVNEIQTPRDRFTHVNVLELDYPILQRRFLRSIYFRYIKSLSILSLDNLLQFTSFERKLRHVNQLSIKNEITMENIQQMMDNSYEQIRKLEINIINSKNQNYIIDGLFRLFPHTEHFIYKSDIQSIALMIRFIDGFTHLLNASFISLGPFFNENLNLRFNPDLIILKSNRLTYGLSMCRIYYLPVNRSSFGIEWWIEE